MGDRIRIEVAYARPERQEVVQITMPAGSSLEQAITTSGLMTHYPEIELDKGKFGIFGKLSRLETVLRDRDRVEIYRPLIADPKEVRKQRVAESKITKKGGDPAE